MVDVEEGALGTLQQHGLTGLQGVVEQQPGVSDAVREALRLSQQSVGDLGRVQGLAVVNLDQHLVLELQRCADLGGQQAGIQHVGDPDADAGDLVLIARTDSAAGGADLLTAQIPLGHLVDGDVVRHQQMGVGGDQQPRGVHTTIVKPAQLGQQHTGVHHHTVADHVGHPGGEDARGDQMQGEVLPAREDHRVAGIVAALVAHDPLHTTTE